MSMKVKDREKNNFTPAPSGIHHATCTKVEDLGEVESEWEGKKSKRPMVALHFELDDRMEDGRPYIATKRYSITSYAEAPLRMDLQGWFGRAFTDAEFGDLDIEDLKGKRCQLAITHRAKNGKTYANITTIQPPPAAPTYASLSQDIERCWTPGGLDNLKEKALAALRAGGITREELQLLGAASQAKRQRIAESGSTAQTPEEESPEIPF